MSTLAALTKRQHECAPQRAATITALQHQGTRTPAPEKRAIRSSMPPPPAKPAQTAPVTPVTAQPQSENSRKITETHEGACWAQQEKPLERDNDAQCQANGLHLSRRHAPGQADVTSNGGPRTFWKSQARRHRLKRSQPPRCKPSLESSDQHPPKGGSGDGG